MAIVSPAAKTADMTANSNTGYYRAFFQELIRLGYIEGQNIIIERYSGGGETARYAQLATDVVGTHPDLIVATATPISNADEKGDAEHTCRCFIWRSGCNGDCVDACPSWWQ